MSQEDISPGKTVTFSVQATGAEPVKYLWQWRQFGKDSQQHEWQNLSSEGGTFEVVKVQACNAGYYRCEISNCAGKDISQCASLTVGKHMYW